MRGNAAIYTDDNEDGFWATGFLVLSNGFHLSDVLEAGVSQRARVKMPFAQVVFFAFPEAFQKALQPAGPPVEPGTFSFGIRGWAFNPGSR